jgi:hypothetical protein
MRHVRNPTLIDDMAIGDFGRKCAQGSSRSANRTYSHDWQVGQDRRRLLVLALACILQCGMAWTLHALLFSEHSFSSGGSAFASLNALDWPPACLKRRHGGEFQDTKDIEGANTAVLYWSNK